MTVNICNITMPIPHVLIHKYIKEAMANSISFFYSLFNAEGEQKHILN